MTLSEELRQLTDNAKKDVKQLYEKVKQYPLVSLLFISVVFLLIAVPHWQVSEINNVTEKVAQENQSRATLAQVLGGTAIGITLYYTWRRISIAEEELKATREGQITERFTRAVEQLGACDKEGNPAIEIRLGGIYALERIANESDKDYWPIMEILTAYVRKNSRIPKEIYEEDSEAAEAMDEYIDEKNREIFKFDIQAITSVIRKSTIIRKNKSSFNTEEFDYLDLKKTDLRRSNFQEADLTGANLEESNLRGSNLKGDNLVKAKLVKAKLRLANLEQAKLCGASLQDAEFYEANLKNADLNMANLQDAEFYKANLKDADLNMANLQGANFRRAILGGANLKGAKHLTVDQLSKVKTLYNAKLDPDLEKELRAKGFGHLIDNEPDDLL